MKRFRTLVLVVLALLLRPTSARSQELPEAPPDSSGETVLPMPPPAPGGNQGGLFYCRVHLPRPGYRVVVKYYDASCAALGGLCQTMTVVAGSDAAAWVPLVYGVHSGPFTLIYYWWDKVRFEFPAITQGAFFDAALDNPLELQPDSRSGDRWPEYTPSCTVDNVRVLNKICDIQAKCQQMTGYSRGSIRVEWGTKAMYGFSDKMTLPDLSVYDELGGGGEREFTWVVAHEYMHAIQHAEFGVNSACTWDNTSFWSFVISDCSSHDGCFSGQSLVGSYTEGMADAFGTWMTPLLYSEPLGPPWPQTCWERFPSSPEVVGPAREFNVQGYFYPLLVQNPVAAMNTARLGRIAEVSGQTHPITTVTQLYSVASDQDQEANRWIAVHQPYPTDTQYLYRNKIYAMDVTGVETPPPSGFTEYEKLHWIRHISPNPVSARFILKVRALVPNSRVAELTVFAVTGRLITRERFNNLPNGDYDFNVKLPDGLPSGVYLVHYEDPLRHRLKDSAKFLVVK